MLLLLAFAVQTFGRAMIVFDYRLNKTTYLKNCVNKARPMLQCQGKCQLAKKMLEQQQKEEKEQQKKNESKADQSLSSRSYFPAAVCMIDEQPLYYPVFCIGDILTQSRTLLRPPIA